MRKTWFMKPVWRYNNITDTRLPWDKVWTPDIVLYNRWRYIVFSVFVHSLWIKNYLCRTSIHKIKGAMSDFFHLAVFFHSHWLKNLSSTSIYKIKRVISDFFVFTALGTVSREERWELSFKWSPFPLLAVFLRTLKLSLFL